MKAALFAAFVATVVAANWALNRWGIVPIGFGLEAPAGVYFAGLAFGLRDGLFELGGRLWVGAAILVGATVSLIISDAAHIPGGVTSIAVASAAAFGLSELADAVVYEPLRDRNWPAAVTVSNLVGAVVDSALFLWLAFGSLAHMAGQVVGKTYMVALALPLVWGCRHAVSRYSLNRAGA
jgi:hypothetical protein